MPDVESCDACVHVASVKPCVHTELLGLVVLHPTPIVLVFSRLINSHACERGRLLLACVRVLVCFFDVLASTSSFRRVLTHEGFKRYQNLVQFDISTPCILRSFGIIGTIWNQ